MKQDKIRDVYADMLLSKEPQVSKDDSQLNYINQYLPNNKNINILDAGCGNGNYSFYLSELGYENIYAVDLFEDIETDKFKYSKSSIDSLPYEDSKFDFIYSNSVIYYLDNPEDGIKEYKRVLKQGELLYFSAHTKYSLFTLHRVIKRDILKLKSMRHLENTKFYSGYYYESLLKKNGFEIILQDGYNISFFFYPLYQKFTRLIEKTIGISLPHSTPYINNGIIGKIKSEISYHSIFVARKIDV